MMIMMNQKQDDDEIIRNGEAGESVEILMATFKLVEIIENYAAVCIGKVFKLSFSSPFSGKLHSWNALLCAYDCL